MRRILTILMSLAALTVAGDGHAQLGVVSIDNVTHQRGPTYLGTGNVVQVSIRYNCLGLSSENLWNGTNGFEIFSPDGADWGYLQAAVGPLVEASGPPMIFMRHYNFNGSVWSETGNGGADPAGGSTGSTTRAGFYFGTLSVMGTEGYVGGTDNDIAVSFEFRPDPADEGLYICIDTVDTIIAWEWAAAHYGDFPQWDNGLGVDGPRCWELVHSHCCQGLVGNANGLGGDEPTIGDIAAMVDAKFISGTCTGLIPCFGEADVNQSGGYDPTCDDLTIADISILIDYLFINGPSLVNLPGCLF